MVEDHTSGVFMHHSGHALGNNSHWPSNTVHHNFNHINANMPNSCKDEVEQLISWMEDNQEQLCCTSNRKWAYPGSSASVLVLLMAQICSSGAGTGPEGERGIWVTRMLQSIVIVYIGLMTP